MHLTPNVMPYTHTFDSGFENVSSISVFNDEDGIN